MKYSAIAVLVAALLLFGLGYQAARWRSGGALTVWSTGPTVTHLESMGQLVTMKVHVSDVLGASDESYRGSWLVKGDGLLAIDLSRAKIVSCDKTRRHAIVELPGPKLLVARVDHEKTKTWSVEKTTWIPFKGNADVMRDQAMKEAQKLVAFASASKENVNRAKASAETIIANVYRMVDWDVVIQWEQVKE